MTGNDVVLTPMFGAATYTGVEDRSPDEGVDCDESA